MSCVCNDTGIDGLLVCRVKFTVEKEVRDFIMIERHYFRNRLLKEFEFTFPFCIPGSTNSVEQIYEVPTLSDEESKSEFIQAVQRSVELVVEYCPFSSCCCKNSGKNPEYYDTEI